MPGRAARPQNSARRTPSKYKPRCRGGLADAGYLLIGTGLTPSPISLYYILRLPASEDPMYYIDRARDKQNNDFAKFAGHKRAPEVFPPALISILRTKQNKKYFVYLSLPNKRAACTPPFFPQLYQITCPGATAPNLPKPQTCDGLHAAAYTLPVAYRFPDVHDQRPHEDS